MQPIANSNKQGKKTTHSSVFAAIIFLAFIILVLRRPDALLNPQFWAEDGVIWYADAYHLGSIQSLFLSYAGYCTFVARLVAAVVQAFPLPWAPAIFNLVAIIIQILPIILISSSRFSVLIPSFPVRLFLIFVYLLLPTAPEIHANITNSQWYLALLAYMVLVAKSSYFLRWKIFDICAISLSALSGPYCFFLTPIAGFLTFRRRNKWSVILFIVMLSGTLVQFFIAIKAKTTLAPVKIPIKTVLTLFSKILTGQVFLGSLIGHKVAAKIEAASSLYSFLAVFVAIAGISLLIYALLRASLELKLFILYAACILGSALIIPVVRGDTIESFWGAMSVPGLGGRYYFIPNLAFITTLVWLLKKMNPRPIRLAARFALCTLLIGIIIHFKHPPFTDFQFGEYARQFEDLPSGSEFKIPINPPGWSMNLTKH